MRRWRYQSSKWISTHRGYLIGGLVVLLGLYWYTANVVQKVGFLQWSGSRDKTFWDAVEVAIVPATLALGGFLFARSERRAELKRIEQESRNRALEAYLSAMTDLIVNHALASPKASHPLRATARALTISVVEQLDGERKASVLRFLYEAGLVTAPSPIISLDRANLSKMLLGFSSFPNISLHGANLRKSQLLFVDLKNSDLSDANLAESTITKVDITGANLRRANFTAAGLTATDLSRSSLHGAQFQGIDPYALTIKQAVRSGRVSADFISVTLTDATYDHLTVWPNGFTPSSR